MEEGTIELGSAILQRHRAMYRVQMEMAERAWDSATYAATVGFVSALQRRWSPVADGGAEDPVVQRTAGGGRRPSAPRVVEGERVLPVRRAVAAPVEGQPGERVEAPQEQAREQDGEQVHEHGPAGPAAAEQPPGERMGREAAVEEMLHRPWHPTPGPVVAAPQAAAGEHAAGAGAHEHPPGTGASAALTMGQTAGEWSAEIPGREDAPLTWADRESLLQAGVMPHATAASSAVPAAGGALSPAPASGTVYAPAAGPAPALAARPATPPELPSATAAPALPPSAAQSATSAAMAPAPGEWSAIPAARGNAPLTWADRAEPLRAGLMPHPQPANPPAAPGHGAQRPAAGQHPAEGGAHGSASSPAETPHAVPAASAGTWTNKIGEGPSGPLTWRDRGRLIAEAFSRDTQRGTHELPAAVRPGESGPAEHWHPQPGIGDPLPAPAMTATARGAGGAGAGTGAGAGAGTGTGVAGGQPVEHSAGTPTGTPPAAATGHGSEPSVPHTVAAAPVVVSSQPIDPNRPWHGPGSTEYELAHPSAQAGATGRPAGLAGSPGAAAAPAASVAPPALAATPTAPAAPGLVYRETPGASAPAPPAPPAASAAAQGQSGSAAMSAGTTATGAAAMRANAAGAGAGAHPSGPAAPDPRALSEEISGQMLRRFAREMALEAERRGVVAWDY